MCAALFLFKLGLLWNNIISQLLHGCIRCIPRVLSLLWLHGHLFLLLDGLGLSLGRLLLLNLRLLNLWRLLWLLGHFLG